MDAPVLPLADCADLPALEQLARALWRTDGPSGAALLVGAGLSRGAKRASADIPPPPLWSDLARAMTSALYPTDAGRAPWDPLRLAEEYRTYFGQPALDSFIREHVRDVSWHPSEDHVSLLDLPWSDVLTTNYDTLLERAARVADRSYEPVRSEHEIAFARAPRIIKLHGSIGVSDHFIIAEDDFRTYPSCHAAFVNLARQCFVENDLCLIGFSGDDPNFLAWAGWVRDHLGKSARRIYLAGALNLSPAKRKYLEARNIAPIDVYDQVRNLEAEQQHLTATSLILQTLHALRPVPSHEWKPTRVIVPQIDEDEAKKLADIALTHTQWRKERLSYPGWLICPHSVRSDLRSMTDFPYKPLLEKLAAPERADMLYEWCWRHQTALWSIYPYQAGLLREYADPASSPHLNLAKRMTIANALIDHAEEAGDDTGFSEMAALIESSAGEGSDGRAALRLRQARRAMRDMDFPTALALAPEVNGTDPAWRLRRSALLADLGHLTEAENLITETLADLRELERNDRGSLWIRSRLAWATFVHTSHRRDHMESGGRWNERFRASHCDPWQEIESLREDVVEARRADDSRISRPTPNFKPGSYQLPERTIQLGEARAAPADELARLFEVAGVPVRLEFLTFFAPDRLEALELVFEPTLPWYLRLISAGLHKKAQQFERYFSRVAIASLEDSVASGLIDRLTRARDYWLGQLTASDQRLARFSADRLNFLLLLLGRLCIRLDSSSASALHLDALELRQAPEFQHPRFDDSFNALLSNSYDAVNPALREPLIIAGLELPRRQPHHGSDPLDWLRHAQIKQPRRNPRIRAIVAKEINELSGDMHMRRSALGRLIYLNMVGALTTAELRRFSAAAWGSPDRGDPPLPSYSFVFEYLWASVPAPDGDARDIVQKRIYNLSVDLNEARLYSMLRAAQYGKLLPTAAQACALFDLVAPLRHAEVDPTDFAAFMSASFRGYDAEQETMITGLVLSTALAPALAASDLTTERREAISRFVAETGSLSAIGAFVPFIAIHPDAREALETYIRRGLNAADDHQVNFACQALQSWIETYPSGRDKVPAQLIDQLVSVVEIRLSPALPRLLEIVEWLVTRALLSTAQLHRISTALSDLVEETAYGKTDPTSELAGRISLIRKNAVRLSHELAERHGETELTSAWKKIGLNDPMPEVRFALTA